MSILFKTPVFLFPNFFSFVQKSYKLRCYKRISCPEKFFNKPREKIPYFFTCICYRRSAADTSLALRTTRSGQMNERQNLRHSQSKVVCGNFLGLWRLTLKNPYHLRTVTFKLSLKGKKTSIRKEKPKVTHSMALMIAFLEAESGNRLLEDLSQADLAVYLKHFFCQ